MALSLQPAPQHERSSPMLRASELAERLGGRLDGGDPQVSGLSAPEEAQAGAVVLVTDRKQAERLEATAVAVLVVPDAFEPAGIKPRIHVREPRLALAQLARIFDTRPHQAEGVAASAIVHESARLGAGIRLGEGAVVEANAVIGDGAVIGANCVIGQGAVVGEQCRLYAGVILYDGVRLGRRVILHSGVVIGADGFGYAPGPGGIEKIPHLGSVEIDDDVEIGANSCVDRGTLASTRIGPRTKIDNLCQIAHNTHIGSDCLIAGLVGIAGSVIIGDRVTIGGSAAVADHLHVGHGARIAGRAGVTKNVPAQETWAGFPAAPYRQWVRGLYLQGRLERIWAHVQTAGKAGQDD